jgi:FixJ family two-component response regulator
MSHEPTVFVVEDDEAHRKSLAWLIESVGLRVETHPSAQAFLDALDPERTGCVVADLRMPGPSGLDLQQELIARASLLPMILISGHSEIPAAVRAMRAGALDFIEKPFSDQHLLDRIREALERNEAARKRFERRASLAARLSRLTAQPQDRRGAPRADHDQDEGGFGR